MPAIRRVPGRPCLLRLPCVLPQILQPSFTTPSFTPPPQVLCVQGKDPKSSMLRLLVPVRTLSRSHVAAAAAAAAAPFGRRTMTTESDAAASEPVKQSKPVKQKLTDPGSHRDMRRAFYIDAVVDKVMNQMLGHPYRMWTEARAEWYRVLSTRQGCSVLLRNNFLSLLGTQIRERELNATRKYGSHLICLGRSLDEHRLIKKDLYRYKYLALCEAAKDAETTASAAPAKLS